MRHIKCTDCGAQDERFGHPWERLYARPSSPHDQGAKVEQPPDDRLLDRDGGTLRTVRQACDDMTSIGKQRELRQHWQRACKLILAKADVMTVSRALELALFMDADLDVSKLPAK